MEGFTSFRNEAPDPVIPGTPKPQEPSKSAREEALEREISELKQVNQQWMEMAKRNQPQAPPPAQDKKAAPVHDEEEDLDIFGEEEDIADDTPDEAPEALVDAISKEGLSALKKRGFVRESDVRKMVREEAKKISLKAARGVVSAERQRITTDSAIMRDFPDLADQDSDLFKMTAEIVRDTVKIDPRAAKSQGTLYAAARAAKAALTARRPAREANDEEDAPRPTRRAANRDDDDDFLDEREERQARVRAQAPPERSRSRSRIESNEDDEVPMSTEAKDIARMMGLTDEEYRSEAKRLGVNKTRGGRR